MRVLKTMVTYSYLVLSLELKTNLEGVSSIVITNNVVGGTLSLWLVILTQ